MFLALVILFDVILLVFVVLFFFKLLF